MYVYRLDGFGAALLVHTGTYDVALFPLPPMPYLILPSLGGECEPRGFPLFVNKLHIKIVKTSSTTLHACIFSAACGKRSRHLCPPPALNRCVACVQRYPRHGRLFYVDYCYNPKD